MSAIPFLRSIHLLVLLLDKRRIADHQERPYVYKHCTGGNFIFNLCCRLCVAYEHKAFLDGLQYGAHLIVGLHK